MSTGELSGRPSAELAELLAALAASPPDPDASLADRRARSAATFGGPPPPGVRVDPVVAGGVPAEWVRAPGVPDRAVTLLVRGGGFCIGGVAGRRRLAAAISAHARTSVLVLDYRLAPEHPFPAAFDDVVAAYRWLLDEHGADPARLGVLGDSAGGSLLLGALVALRDEGVAMPAAAVALSPWVDLDVAGRPAPPDAVDPLVTVETLQLSAQWYLAGASARDPRMSPVNADLTGLPPLLVQVGSGEVLRTDAQRLADLASAAGVEVTLQVWDGVPHVWHLFAHLPEAHRAIARIGEFLLARTGVPVDRR
ncbi:alpha/beta hydrolase [Pseudonocardia sp. CA-107938]|uniref:alpha/beta hydrolase n=1 Tax=Pseudonocardia sp. CA-107938 TaxID=3240021 RepID=UPI003D90914D